MDYLNEIPKHRKKAKRTVTKSKHKHQYMPCYIEYEYLHPITKERIIHQCLSLYCTICGYIGDILILNFQNNKISRDYNLTKEDYKKLPIFFVDDITKTKYINLAQEI